MVTLKCNGKRNDHFGETNIPADSKRFDSLVDGIFASKPPSGDAWNIKMAQQLLYQS